jgi:hypothetical protein
MPRTHVDDQLRFADGTSASVYRETVVDRPLPAEPAVLLVARSGSAAYEAGGTACSGWRACSIPHSSSGSTGSSRSCGWPTTSGIPTVGCISGTPPA